MRDARGVIHVHQRRVAGFEQKLGIVVAANTDIDARAGVIEFDRGLAGVFERLPTHLQQQPLLRIHGERFPRRDLKELRLEVIHLVQKCAKRSRDLAGRVRVRIVVCLGIPAIRRDFPDSATPLAQQPPELLGVVGPAWNSTTHSDNGDGFVLSFFDGIELSLQFFNCEQGSFQGRKFRRVHGDFRSRR